MHSDKSGESDETNDRLEYLGSFLASLVVLGTMALVAATAAGFASLSVIPQSWFALVIVPLVIMAAIQAFGKDVFQAFKEYRGGK